MGKEPLWVPSGEVVEKANMTAFMRFVNEKYGRSFSSYRELYDWSVESISDFWAAVWDFCGIVASKPYEEVVDDPYRMPGAKWFQGARLNFAENLLRYRDDRVAIVFVGEQEQRRIITYRELYSLVGKISRALRELGVKAGDRVVGYMPNMIETVAFMLGATSIGAIWSSCAADMGPEAVYDRFGQVEPKVMITADGYFYKGKMFNTFANAVKLASRMPSLERVVVAKYSGADVDLSRLPNAVTFYEFVGKEDADPVFEQLPFDHPVYIMFSSGTTGKPKCMVQSAGGVLINHLKELKIHSDLRREDRIFYITTCSWMMWNWLVSSLGVGATVVLYDGNPLYPDPYAMWRMVDREGITIFGLSASYINALRKEGVSPGKECSLETLRQISQTGSALSADGFRYVYSDIKSDLHFNSISGGTDINGCFAIGSPIQPVYAGELQGPGLGMKVKAYDENGNPVWDREGELVCEAAAPSMPLYFWNDPEGKKYREAYFEYFPGKNVWRHGDYVIFHSDTGGITFLGRSDSVLKPSGVRIGTAEIYNQVENIPEIADSLAIGQQWEGDQRIILFVKMKEGYKLTDEVKAKIRKVLRENASPRHVPAKIIEVPDIPYTRNMKKVESAVTNIIHGRPVTNLEALVNPECLDYFKDHPELKS
ncbi:acetoacetate--CoA ligase [Thermodesulforhabdus norvegica]|uniref:Acetoacetyl-CoA synthetase n=1 Tax=Thermodesulforhabdus norvegica TaxID=39841 RepID=A0A1I4W2L6_9BACT|nr:acetoacetate--CoA ligase [Thermodesulforhabdus norvegica]SFN07854.1 acetoacetyl-CoA synthetase [Thermodesulforhabdus norvegica]